jgi:hypothetical protein
MDKDSAVVDTLRKIALRLDEIGVPYAATGGVALFLHGIQRSSEDVHLLVTRASLRKIHEELEGRGYFSPATGSKNLRDSEHGVRIVFAVSGNYPGDAKPKPVAFPDPAESSVEIDGIRVLAVEKLIELKLAAGMTNPQRQEDIAEVSELIRILKLPQEFVERLHPFVQDKYRELWALECALELPLPAPDQP